jgi:hypothetical protein
MDTNEIARCNQIGLIWANKIGIKKTKYFSFICQIIEDPSAYKKVLGAEYDAFIADLDKILYAQNFVNYYCEKYRKMVYKVCNKFKSKYVRLDERESYGFEGVWKALFTYRMIDGKFNLWIYVGIKQSVQGCIMHEIQRRKTKKGQQFHYCKRLFKYRGGEEIELQIVDKRIDDPAKIAADKEADHSVVNCWLQRADVKGEYKIIWDFYITGDVDSKSWIDRYLEDLKSRTGEAITKAGVHEKVRRIKSRLLEVIKEDRGAQFVADLFQAM